MYQKGPGGVGRNMEQTDQGMAVAQQRLQDGRRLEENIILDEQKA
jgi:hypothetical protein